MIAYDLLIYRYLYDIIIVPVKVMELTVLLHTVKYIKKYYDQ